MPASSYRISPTQTNPWGLASLISGIVGFCPLPFLGGVAAVAFGFLGLRRARETHTGKGLATTGLILGIASLLIWAIIAAVTHAGYRFFSNKIDEGARNQTEGLIRDLRQGNISDAASRCDGLGENELRALSDSLKGLGNLKEVQGASYDSGDGTLRGTAVFESGKRDYTARLAWNEGNGWVVKSLSFGP